MMKKQKVAQKENDENTFHLPPLGSTVPTYEELEQQYCEDTDKLCNDHEKLIEQILE